MATMLLRASLRRNGLGLGQRPPVFQAQRRLQSSPSKAAGIIRDGAKAVDSTPVSTTASAAVAPLPLWQRLGPLTTAAQAYGRSQRARPYTTQFWSAVIIYLLADLSAQSIGGDEYDPVRTARSMAIGGMVAIPNYKWFIFLSNHFNYASRWRTLSTKIVVSQIVFTPTFNSFFFGAQAVLSGDGISGAVERIKNCVPASIVNSAKFWPPFTAFCFTYIPMEYRSIFTGCIAVGWQTYLSYINKQAELLEAQKTGLEQGKLAVVKVEEVKVKGVKLEDVKLVAVEAQAA
ncbi:Mpv17/PMP22 family protein [Ilyonectria destructans]|nr:Mpv17/PMP22 family protein [Ilyonectria destructans]